MEREGLNLPVFPPSLFLFISLAAVKSSPLLLQRTDDTHERAQKHSAVFQGAAFCHLVNESATDTPTT